MTGKGRRDVISDIISGSADEKQSSGCRRHLLHWQSLSRVLLALPRADVHLCPGSPPVLWSWPPRSTPDVALQCWSWHASSCSFTPLWAQLKLCLWQRKDLLVKMPPVLCQSHSFPFFFFYCWGQFLALCECCHVRHRKWVTVTSRYTSDLPPLRLVHSQEKWNTLMIICKIITFCQGSYNLLSCIISESCWRPGCKRKLEVSY